LSIYYEGVAELALLALGDVGEGGDGEEFALHLIDENFNCDSQLFLFMVFSYFAAYIEEHLF